MDVSIEDWMDSVPSEDPEEKAKLIFNKKKFAKAARRLYNLSAFA